MIDIFLLIVTLVAFCLCGVIGVYLMVHYQHPDDKNEAWFPKFVVLFGFILACGSVLSVSLDVANNDGYVGCDGFDTKFCGGLNMEVFWQVIFWMLPIWMFLLIPFATFFYEADDGMLMAGTAVNPEPKKKSKVLQALVYTGFTATIMALIFVCTYFLFSDTNIPIAVYESPELVIVEPPVHKAGFRRGSKPGELKKFDRSVFMNMTDADVGYMRSVQPKDVTYITLRVHASTFYAGLMAWMGWFLFALFGGIGLAAMPLDLILTYVNRPRHLDAAEFADIQTSLRERTNELVDIGELIKIERQEKADLGLQSKNAILGFSLFNPEKRKEAKEERQAILGFKQAVFLLEQDVEDFQNCHANWENYNPLIPYASLLFGCISIILTIIWILHICIYVLPTNPPTSFMNGYLTWFDGWFPLFGVLTMSIFSMYLLLCAVKGCFKFGLRFICFQLHPMKVGKTYMSSMLFNIGLVLFVSMPVVQLTSLAFADYARYSTIRQLFGVQIQYQKFFGWFWVNNVFIYCLIIIFFLTCAYLTCKPKDQSTSSVALRDRLRARRN